ncbi:MAG: hypothetical protein ABH830_02985 [Patescibacteria group bacterium]
MNYQHKQLSQGRWNELFFREQMANVGSEVERIIKWREKGNHDYSQKALDRALELLNLTINDSKNKNKLKEITRTYEALVDYFMFDNNYGSTDKLWQNYFYAFSWASRIRTI